MIKGKFYTGLTSEMMARSRIVNRQETHFFWPDESRMETVQSRKVRASSILPTTSSNNNNSNSAPTKSNNNNNNSFDRCDSIEIKPKELFRKQLSSGIEFHDNVNAKTPESHRRRFKKIDNINLNNNDNNYQPQKKKLETFSSKIEFYDYDDEPIPTMKKESVKNATRSKIDEKKSVDTKSASRSFDVRNSSNSVDDKHAKSEIDQPLASKVGARKIESPDVTKKRITFHADAEKTTKGILKNSSNDDKSTETESNVVEVKPLHKRGLLPKSMSKSVENITKMTRAVENDMKTQKNEPKKAEALSAIVREVNNLNLTSEKARPAKYEDDDLYRGRDGGRYGKGEVLAGRRPIEDRRPIAERRREYSPQRHDDYTERREYRDVDHRHRHDDYDGRDYNDRYEDPRQRGSYSMPGESYEPRRYRPVSHRIDEQPVHGSRNSSHRTSDYGMHRDERDAGHRDVYRSRIEPDRFDNLRPDRSVRANHRPTDYYDKPLASHRSPHFGDDNIEDYGYVASSQPARHLPHHLRTNILSNGLPRPQSQRPVSVRNSAVTRVGVGLPDYE